MVDVVCAKEEPHEKHTIPATIRFECSGFLAGLLKPAIADCGSLFKHEPHMLEFKINLTCPGVTNERV